jgi:deoxycytidylate deaminase
MAIPTYSPIEEEELVFGLVYGAGTEVEPVERLLAERLQPYGYELRSVHLSEYFSTILTGEPFLRETPDATRKLQGMGDELRKRTANDVLATLAAYLIGATRARDHPPSRTAWLVQSFKRPEEIQAMRAIYGPRFILVGVHVPEVIRHRAGARRWQRWAAVTTRRYEEEATTDIRRDEHDPAVTYGQELRLAFAEADFFIDARTDARLKDTLPRVIRLIFAEPFEPPQRDELAMYHAFTAGLRSAEMGRQVGAAIVSPQGDVVAVGTNEVPAGDGGLCWSPDQPDGRDFAQQPPLDSNTVWQRRIARELVVTMAKSGWLDAAQLSVVREDEPDINEEQLDRFLRDVAGTRFADITEFGRAVHAEMDALTTAARFGRPVNGCTAVVTTTPCHGCARHLIASGIRRVVFIHPYEKSLARDLHEDALVLEPETPGPTTGKVAFEQYIGVAPRCFPQYFDFGQTKRRDHRGRAARPPKRSEALARVLQSAGSFSFGGPTVPHTAASRLEKRTAQRFQQLADDGELNVPQPATHKESRT